MKHAKPSKNPRRAAIALAIGSTGAFPIIVATSAIADTSTTTTVVSGDTTATPCEDYIVARGDDLSSVADHYGVPLETLKTLNPGIIAGDRPDDYSLVYRGGHIHLPTGNCEPAPTTHHKWKKHHRHHHSGGGSTTPTTTPTTPTTPAPPAAGGGSTVPVIAPDCAGTSSGYCAHDVTFWAPLIEQAMDLVGGNVGATRDVSGVEALMSAESGGDPNAINNSDSNAAAGTPSEGLMQVIQPTFDANHVAGTSDNLYDPLANIAASLAYINAQYGGVIPGSPY